LLESEGRLETAVGLLTEFLSVVADLERNVSLISSQQDSRKVRGDLAKFRSQGTQLLKQLHQILAQKFAGEERIRHERLLEQFNSAAKRFNELVQKSASLERTYALSASPAAEPEDLLSDVGAPQLGSWGSKKQLPLPKQQQQLVQRQNSDVDAMLVDETNREWQQLEGDLAMLADVMKDVREMVGDQGEKLDETESNVKVADVKVDQGVGELKAAYEYKQGSRKKLCCIIICCLLVTVLIVAGVILAIYFLVIRK